MRWDRWARLGWDGGMMEGKAAGQGVGTMVWAALYRYFSAYVIFLSGAIAIDLMFLSSKVLYGNEDRRM